jgi:Tol biopolymer transport system component
MVVLSLGSALALAAPALQVAAADGANLQRPVWSPDGRLLSYEANFHEAKRVELWLGDPTARRFDPVKPQSRPGSSALTGFQTTTTQVVHELAFAPRGIDAVVYAASNVVFDYDLYISSGTSLTQGTSVAPADGADGGARWSPDGAYIAFTSARTGEGDLYLLDTNHVELPPKRLTTQTDSSELYADWSADGKTLVYVAHTTTGDNLWSVAATGSAPTRITSWSGNQIRPRWSPVGKSIAFYANHEDDSRFDLYVTEPGATPRLLARGVYPDARGPAWTADGQYVVFVADDDAQMDPVRAVRVSDPTRVATLPLGTVNNGDLDVTVRNGAPTIAVVAQGLETDPVRDFKRLFVATLPPLP